tara:strand:- start:1121 stop:1411 length:291 start_codon:yes stop_codon:yes gene_type:complete
MVSVIVGPLVAGDASAALAYLLAVARDMGIATANCGSKIAKPLGGIFATSDKRAVPGWCPVRGANMQGLQFLDLVTPWSPIAIVENILSTDHLRLD